MKIYDISQELFSSHVYPGDKAPKRTLVSDMTKGASCNVSELEMNAHNGTHMDAPRHFVRDGKTIDELELTDLSEAAQSFQPKEQSSRSLFARSAENTT